MSDVRINDPNLPATRPAEPGVTTVTPRHTDVGGGRDDQSDVPEMLREGRDALAAAKAAAEAEEAATPATTVTEQPAAGQPPAAPAEQQPRPQWVARTRYEQVWNMGQRAAQEAQYWRGVADAQKAMLVQAGVIRQDGSTPPGAPQPTAPQAPADPASQIQAEQDKLLAAARQFDGGEITMEQFMAVQISASKQIAAIQAAAAVPSTQIPPAAQPSVADQMIQQQHLAKLQQAHPWVNNLTEAQMFTLRDMALSEAALSGAPINTSETATVADTMRLREGIARLSDIFGPRWNPGKVAPPAPARPSGNNGGPQGRPGSGNPGAPRGGASNGIAAKIALADQHPPNTAQSGYTPPLNPGGLPTPEQIEAMSEEDWIALPPAVRHRLLHNTG